MTSPSPADLSPLVDSVRELTNATQATEAALTSVQARVQHHTLALVIGGVGLLLDLVLSVLVTFLLIGQSDINRHQQCVNVRTADYLAAERAKVSGQVAGLRELRDAHGNKVRAVAGFDQFIKASQHYLDSIGAIRERCAL